MKLVSGVILIFGAVLAVKSESDPMGSTIAQIRNSGNSTETEFLKNTANWSPTVVNTTLAHVNPPSNEKGHWNVTNNNSTCILITGFINFHVTVQSPNGKNTFNESVPPHALTDGDCKYGRIRFHLNQANNTLQFTFPVNETHKPKEYALNRVDGQLSTGDLSVGFEGDNLQEFKTKIGQSFQCNTFQKFNFTDYKKDKNTSITVFIELKDFQFQAYKNTTKNDEFGEAIDGCPADHVTPDIVPIIVGCALAILVIVVLVAYLISRKRSEARGYLSM